MKPGTEKKVKSPFRNGIQQIILEFIGSFGHVLKAGPFRSANHNSHLILIFKGGQVHFVIFSQENRQ